MKEYFEKLYKESSDEYYKKIEQYLENDTKKFIITANPETFKISTKDKELEEALLNKENDIIPDGIAIVKCGKMLGYDIKERITGCDTAIKLLELANKKNKSLYLFGASKEVIEKMKDVIKNDYPNINLLGYSNGYEKDKDKIFKNIIKLKPDVCLVALGIPLQEKLINKYISKASKGIYMGVGGSFDVISGSKKRAPKVFIKLNLEWLYRIAKEPKRLKRFYESNIKFVLDIKKEAKKLSHK